MALTVLFAGLSGLVCKIVVHRPGGPLPVFMKSCCTTTVPFRLCIVSGYSRAAVAQLSSCDAKSVASLQMSVSCTSGNLPTLVGVGS